MHDETVETYTNVYARWFAIISQFIVTASLCTLWRLQMTRYSQVLVHSTVVNSRLSHQYMSISPFLWGFWHNVVSPTPLCQKPHFLSCFGIYSDFSYFLPGLCWLLGWVWVLFWWFLQFQLLFLGFSPALWLGLGAVLVISAVSTTFSRVFSGFWAGFGVLFWWFLQFQLLFVRLLA